MARFTSTGMSLACRGLRPLVLARSTVYDANDASERPRTPFMQRRGRPISRPCGPVHRCGTPLATSGRSWRTLPSRRGLSQGVGELPLRPGHPHQQSAGASPDDGRRGSGPPPGEQTPRSQGPQRDHSAPLAARPNVGHAHGTTVRHRQREGMASEFAGGGSLLGGAAWVIHAAKSRMPPLRPWSLSGRGRRALRHPLGQADVAEGLKVRHDLGPAYLSVDFQPKRSPHLGMTTSGIRLRAGRSRRVVAK